MCPVMTTFAKYLSKFVAQPDPKTSWWNWQRIPSTTVPPVRVEGGMEYCYNILTGILLSVVDILGEVDSAEAALADDLAEDEVLGALLHVGIGVRDGRGGRGVCGGLRGRLDGGRGGHHGRSGLGRTLRTAVNLQQHNTTVSRYSPLGKLVYRNSPSAAGCLLPTVDYRGNGRCTLGMSTRHHCGLQRIVLS